jgi:hypothetical protein
MKKARCCCDGGRVDTVGFKLAEGKGLWEGWDSKELWRSVRKLKTRLMFRMNRAPGRIRNGAEKRNA